MDNSSSSLGINISSAPNLDDDYRILSNDKYADLRKQVDFALFIACVALSPVTIVGNLMVHISMYKFRSLRTVTNMFIGSLAVADFLLGFVCLPIYALFFIDSTFGRYKYLCLWKYSAVLVSMTGSLYSLVAISVDRYIAILHPLKYPIIMTRKKAKIIISGIWIYHLIIIVIPSAGWNNYDKYNGTVCNFFKILPLPYTILTAPVSIFSSLFISMYLYRQIFNVASHQLKKRKHRVQSKANLQLQKDMRSVRAMGIILFFFYIFWAPSMFIIPLKYLDIPADISEIIKNFGMIIAMSNSAVNPFMYCWLRKDFCRAFKSILCSYCLENSSAENRRHPDVTDSGASVSKSAANPSNVNVHIKLKSNIKEKFKFGHHIVTIFHIVLLIEPLT